MLWVQIPTPLYWLSASFFIYKMGLDRIVWWWPYKLICVYKILTKGLTHHWHSTNGSSDYRFPHLCLFLMVICPTPICSPYLAALSSPPNSFQWPPMSQTGSCSRSFYLFSRQPLSPKRYCSPLATLEGSLWLSHCQALCWAVVPCVQETFETFAFRSEF